MGRDEEGRPQVWMLVHQFSVSAVEYCNWWCLKTMRTVNPEIFVEYFPLKGIFLASNRRLFLAFTSSNCLCQSASAAICWRPFSLHTHFFTTSFLCCCAEPTWFWWCAENSSLSRRLSHNSAQLCWRERVSAGVECWVYCLFSLGSFPEDRKKALAKIQACILTPFS